MRLRADFWVAAFIRRVAAEGAVAMLRRRGAAEAGAILVKVDRLDGAATLWGPAPSGLAEPPRGVERVFARMHAGETLPTLEIEARIAREIAFDPDLWLIEVEDRQGRSFLEEATG